LYIHFFNFDSLCRIALQCVSDVPCIGEGGVLLLCPPGAETRF